MPKTIFGNIATNAGTAALRGLWEKARGDADSDSGHSASNSTVASVLGTPSSEVDAKWTKSNYLSASGVTGKDSSCTSTRAKHGFSTFPTRLIKVRGPPATPAGPTTSESGQGNVEGSRRIIWVYIFCTHSTEEDAIHRRRRYVAVVSARDVVTGKTRHLKRLI